jgi:hypothetical protein
MNVQLMEASPRHSEATSGLADRNARAPAAQPEPVRTPKAKTSKKEEVPSVPEEKPRKVKFEKGSEEAKAHMAALRAKRGAAAAAPKEKAVKAKKEKAPPSQEVSVAEAPAVQKVKAKKVAAEAPAPVAAKPKKKKVVQVEIEVSDSE